MSILDYALIFLVGAVVTHGIIFAHFQKKYPEMAKRDYKGDFLFSVVISLLWPVSFFVVLHVIGCRRGLKFY